MSGSDDIALAIERVRRKIAAGKSPTAPDATASRTEVRLERDGRIRKPRGDAAGLVQLNARVRAQVKSDLVDAARAHGTDIATVVELALVRCLPDVDREALENVMRARKSAR